MNDSHCTENGFAIEQNVPLPAQGSSLVNPLAVALAKMKAGDSFVIDFKHKALAKYHAKKAGVLIAFRKISKTEIRIWNVSPKPVIGWKPANE